MSLTWFLNSSSDLFIFILLHHEQHDTQLLLVYQIELSTLSIQLWFIHCRNPLVFQQYSQSLNIRSHTSCLERLKSNHFSLDLFLASKYFLLITLHCLVPSLIAGDMKSYLLIQHQQFFLTPLLTLLILNSHNPPHSQDHNHIVYQCFFSFSTSNKVIFQNFDQTEGNEIFGIIKIKIKSDLFI